MPIVMQAASRDALAEASSRLDATIDANKRPADLLQLGDELFAIMRLLQEEPVLRRHLADPSAPSEVRTQLADRVLADKVGRETLDLVSDLVSARWSRPSDLVEALEVLGRQATLAVAEKDGTLEDVEDELFRFGRLLDREPELRTLLADRTTPDEDRLRLLDSLIDGKVKPVTAALLRQVVHSPRGRSLDMAVEELSELAAARRDRYVAHVTTPVRLTDEQEQRLSESLTRLYGRPIALQVELDPDLLGGLVVRVGDEVIDGSVAGRMEQARRDLPT